MTVSCVQGAVVSPSYVSTLHLLFAFANALHIDTFTYAWVSHQLVMAASIVCVCVCVCVSCRLSERPLAN